MKNNLTHVFRITEALERKEYVCFQGDRYLNKREITHDFFHGKRSQISDGPFPAGFEVKSTRRILFCHA